MCFFHFFNARKELAAIAGVTAFHSNHETFVYGSTQLGYDVLWGWECDHLSRYCSHNVLTKTRSAIAIVSDNLSPQTP